MTSASFSRCVIFAWVALLSGCATVTIDRSSAKTLATAGQAATSALQQQANQVTSSLSGLPVVLTVNGILNCRTTAGALRSKCIDGAIANAQSAPLEAVRKQLLDIVDKRSKAFKALNDAYMSFGDLATFDAAKAVATSIDEAFGKINAFTKALSAFPGIGIAIPTISAGITKVVGGVAAAITEERQLQLMLAASRDLHTAVDTLAKALKAEQDVAAMRSLLSELEAERIRLEHNTLEAGLATSVGVLTPFYTKVAPDITLVQTPPAGTADLAIASARQVLRQSTSGRPAAIASSYERAIGALSGMSAEHQKFEERRQVDVSLIIAELQRLHDISQGLGK